MSGVRRGSQDFSLRADLGERLGEVLLGDRLAVEVDVAELLEERQDALALVGQRDDARGLPLDRAGALQGRDDLAHVVAVDGLRSASRRR